MNTAEQNYTVCEKYALAVVFSLKKIRYDLLTVETFTLITDQQAICSAFERWMYMDLFWDVLN